MPRYPRSGSAVSEFAFAAGTATPRKRPLQQRSQRTVSAILDATIRVLDEDGAALTTTRVAEIAGVSVGTLYQYFPNREALMTGVLADHLEAAISAVEAAAEAARGLPLPEAAARVVRAFLAAKTERAPVSRILRRVFGTGMLDERPLVQAATQRAQRAIARMFAAEDAGPDAAAVQRAGVVCAALGGVVTAAVQEDPARLADPAWVDQVVALAVAAVGEGSAKIPSV